MKSPLGLRLLQKFSHIERPTEKYTSAFYKMTPIFRREATREKLDGIWGHHLPFGLERYYYNSTLEIEIWIWKKQEMNVGRDRGWIWLVCISPSVGNKWLIDLAYIRAWPLLSSSCWNLRFGVENFLDFELILMGF